MIKAIVALGNPGKEYAKTRHNAAWILLDAWAAAGMSVPWKLDKELNAMKSEILLGDKRIWMIKPQTFMNLSGEAVRAFSWYYKIPKEEILVVHDEVAFESGKMKLSFGGSSGGHNGVESIIQLLGAQEMWRLRLGVGPRMPDMTLSDWVLGQLSDEAEKWLKSEKAIEALTMIINEGPENTQGKINAG
jgi:PTH1 family peptidyl-tRNA hydrolase